MDSSGFPAGEDGDNNIGTQPVKCKKKPRHKFSNDDQQLLNQQFAFDPYPDFTVRKELAQQLKCHLYVIDNWFQNRRSRLPARERQSIFATKTSHEFPVWDLPKNIQAPCPNISASWASMLVPGALLGGASPSGQNIPEVPADPYGSNNPVGLGSQEQARYALRGNSEHDESGCFTGAIPGQRFGQHFSSRQYFQQEAPQPWETQPAQPAQPAFVASVPGVQGHGGQQQQVPWVPLPSPAPQQQQQQEEENEEYFVAPSWQPNQAELCSGGAVAVGPGLVAAHSSSAGPWAGFHVSQSQHGTSRSNEGPC